MLRCVVTIALAVALAASPALARERVAEAGPPASLVLVSGEIGASAAYGCGVIVREDRSSITVLTAAHNLQMRRLAVTTAADERVHVTASEALPGHDLALITADRPWRRYAVAHPVGDAPLGARVSLWGPIASEPFTPHAAVIRALDARAADVPAGAFALDCAACGHGDSGTGVFNERGALLGIVVASYAADQTRVFVLAERYGPDATVAVSPPRR